MNRPTQLGEPKGPAVSRQTRVSLPDDDYLLLVGQMAYMVGSLEGTILFDLPGLAQHLPADLNPNALAGKTTGALAGALTKAAPSITNDDVRAYVELAANILKGVSSRRNDLLHARPATVDGEQRLNRWKAADHRGPHRAFAISTGWLETEIDRLSEAAVALDAARPLHLNTALTADGAEDAI